jgi:hypothetical protein
MQSSFGCYLVALSLLIASLCESKQQLRGFKIGNNHLSGVLRRDGIERSLYVESIDDDSENTYHAPTEEASSDDDDNIGRTTMTPTAEASEILDEESMREPSLCPTSRQHEELGQTSEPSNLSSIEPIFTSTAEPTATILPLEASSTIQPTDASSLDDTVGFAQGDQTLGFVSPSPSIQMTGEPTKTEFPLQTSTPQPSDGSANEGVPVTSQDTLEPTTSFTSVPTALDLFPTSSPELISMSADDEELAQALLQLPSPFATFEPTGVLPSTIEPSTISTLVPTSTSAQDALTEWPEDETTESTDIPSSAPTSLSMIESADAAPTLSETAEPSPSASPAPVASSEEGETLEPTVLSSIGSTIEATEGNFQMNTGNDILSESTEDDLPTALPTTILFSMLSEVPSVVPSDTPSGVPSDTPSDEPSDTPSNVPSDVPSVVPPSLDSSEVLQEVSSQGGETVFPAESESTDYY